MDENFVYFVGSPEGGYRVPKAGGTPEAVASPLVDLVSVGGPDALDLEIDESHIYLSRPVSFDLGTIFESRVFVYDKAGAPVSSIDANATRVPGDCHVPTIVDFAVTPTGDIYWLQDEVPVDPAIEVPPGGPGPCDPVAQSTLVRVPAGTTQPSILFRTFGKARNLRVDASHLFYVEQAASTRGEMAASIVRRPLPASFGTQDGGTSALWPVADMNIDAHNIYWSAAAGFDGTPATYAVPGPDQNVKILDAVLTQIVADGTFVYGNAPRQGSGAPFNLFRLRPNGHGLFNLAKTGGGALAVDDTYVYYVDASQRSILRTCKLAGL